MSNTDNGIKVKPWHIFHARAISIAIFSVICAFLICIVLAVFYNAILKSASLPRINAIIYLGAGIVIFGTLCGVIAALLNSYASLLIFRTRVKKAIPLPIVMNWYNLSGPHAVARFVLDRNLDVYISKNQSRQIVHDLGCSLLPLYALPIFFPAARATLRAFHEIYFDDDQLDRVLDRELVAINNAAPDKLEAFASKKLQDEADTMRGKSKDQGNKGYDGRLAKQIKRNHFLAAHVITIVRLTLHFSKRWEKKIEAAKKSEPKNGQKIEPIISHKSIQKAETSIRDADPQLTQLLLQKCIRNNPALPEVVRDMFRYAMKDEMVHWPGGKSSLQDLAVEHFKKAEVEGNEEGSEPGVDYEQHKE